MKKIFKKWIWLFSNWRSEILRADRIEIARVSLVYDKNGAYTTPISKKLCIDAEIKENYIFSIPRTKIIKIILQF